MSDAFPSKSPDVPMDGTSTPFSPGGTPSHALPDSGSGVTHNHLILPVQEKPKNRSKRNIFYRFGKRKLRPWFNKMIAASSIYGDPPVFDTVHFPWMVEAATHWKEIRAEMQKLLDTGFIVPRLDEVSSDHGRIAGRGNWRSFFLHAYGYRIEENRARCPKTSAMLDTIPELNSAFFSFLDANSDIPEHRGVTKRVLTCHLPLITVEPNELCRMRVGPETLYWHEGKFIAFDDTYDHQVWNETDQLRVVLLIQFGRPLRQPGRFLGDLFLFVVRHSPFVQEARKNLSKWEEAQKLIDNER